jgi:hypothetical protein
VIIKPSFFKPLSWITNHPTAKFNNMLLQQEAAPMEASTMEKQMFYGLISRHKRVDK